MSKKASTGGGSILLKLLIVVLAGVLVFTVYFSKSQWETHQRDTQLARERMSNVEVAGLQYFYFHRVWPHTLDEIIGSLDTCVVSAAPYRFNVERKVLLPRDLSGFRDSVLISLEDTMRIDTLRYAYGQPETLVLPDSSTKSLYHTKVWAQFKPLYEGLQSDTLHLVSDSEVKIFRRKMGTVGRDLWASTGGLFYPYPDSLRFSHGDTVSQPVKRFSFTQPLHEISTCPHTGKTFILKHICRYAYKGEYLYTINGDEGEVVTTLARKQAFMNELKSMASQAVGMRYQALADSAAAAGDAAYKVPEDLKIEILIEETLAAAATLRSGQRVISESEKTRTASGANADPSVPLLTGGVPVDSVAYYTSDEFREDVLFPEYNSPVAKEQFTRLLADTLVAGLIGRLRVQPSFEAVRVDTVGFAVYSPITGDESYTNGILKLWEVEPPKNDGFIYNGLKSWE